MENITLNTLVRQFCVRHNISLEDLAKHAGMSRGSLYKLLDENISPTLKNMVKLATVMDMHPQYLLKLKWASCQLQELEATPLRSSRNQTTKPRSQVNDATVFIDETIPDNSMVAAGTQFTKTWTVQNVGDVVWENRFLVCMDELGKAAHPAGLAVADYCLVPEKSIIPIPTTSPGETVTLSVKFTAPKIPAKVISYWKSTDENGQLNFPEATGLSVSVRVVTASMVKRTL